MKSPKGTKGGTYPNGVPFYGVENYRADGGLVIGDLYDRTTPRADRPRGLLLSH